MATNLTNIAQQLKALSKSDWEQVRSDVNAWNSSPGGNPNHHLPEKDIRPRIVVDCIIEVLSGLGVEHSYAALLMGGQSYQAFKNKIPALFQYLMVKNRNEQRALLCIGIELLYENLLAMGTPTSSRTLMNHIHRIPAVMNREFPGYAKSGMLGWILRNK